MSIELDTTRMAKRYCVVIPYADEATAQAEAARLDGISNVKVVPDCRSHADVDGVLVEDDG